jgi:rhodanese-related sulfurtransferase
VDRFLLFLAQEWMLLGSLVLLLLAWFMHETRSSGAVVTSAALTRYINGGKALVLDLCPEGEFTKGHIMSAQNIPYAMLKEKVDSFRKWQDKPVILVCAYGMQSRTAARTLKAMGFMDTMRLRGGIEEWRRENLPLLS